MFVCSVFSANIIEVNQGMIVIKVLPSEFGAFQYRYWRRVIDFSRPLFSELFETKLMYLGNPELTNSTGT